MPSSCPPDTPRPPPPVACIVPTVFPLSAALSFSKNAPFAIPAAATVATDGGVGASSSTCESSFGDETGGFGLAGGVGASSSRILLVLGFAVMTSGLTAAAACSVVSCDCLVIAAGFVSIVLLVVGGGDSPGDGALLSPPVLFLLLLLLFLLMLSERDLCFFLSFLWLSFFDVFFDFFFFWVPLLLRFAFFFSLCCLLSLLLLLLLLIGLSLLRLRLRLLLLFLLLLPAQKGK